VRAIRFKSILLLWRVLLAMGLVWHISSILWQWLPERIRSLRWCFNHGKLDNLIVNHTNALLVKFSRFVGFHFTFMYNVDVSHANL
jgi:hypothetical protein